MVGKSNQNIYLIQIDASNFAEFEISEFEISRFDCILQIRMSLPTPSKPKTSDDKATDIGDFGNAVQDLLKAMKI